MSLDKAFSLGLAANEASKVITGTRKTTAARSAVATGTGAALGAAASGGLVVAAELAGATVLTTTAAPLVVPLAVASGAVAFVASLFGDD